MEPYKTLRDNLIFGDIKEISKRTGINLSVVWRHIHGKTKRQNMKIIDAAIDVIAERKQESEKLNNRISEVIGGFFICVVKQKKVKLCVTLI